MYIFYKKYTFISAHILKLSIYCVYCITKYWMYVYVYNKVKERNS